MANLSNINNILRTNSTGVGIFDDAANYPLEISSATTAGMRLINTAGATYDVYGNTSEEFLITKVGVGERLKIASGGAITFNNAYTFPTAVTTTNNYVLTAQTDGSTAWAADGGGTVKGTGTATRVAFWSASDTISSHADFYWDNANDRLGIGVGSAPLKKLNVQGTVRIQTNTNYYSDRTYLGDTWEFASDTTDGVTFSITGGLAATAGNYFRWLTQEGAATPIERMRITSSGNVGIGTASPDCKLDIRKGGTTSAQGDTDLLIGDSTAASSTAQVQILGGATGYSNLYFSDTAAYNVGGFIYNHTSNYLATNVNAAERMRIDSDGNVGIGTVPSRRLDVRDPSNSQNTILAYNNGASFTGTVYEAITDRVANSAFNLMNLKASTVSKFLVRGDGNVGIGTDDPQTNLEISDASAAGLTIRSVSLTGYSLINFADAGDINVGRIYYGHDDNAMRFRTNDVERMRIDSSGDVGIGTASPVSKLSINSNGIPIFAAAAMATTGLTVHNSTGGTAIQIGTYDAGAYNYIQSGYVNSAGTPRELRFYNGSINSLKLTTTGDATIEGGLTVGGGTVYHDEFTLYSAGEKSGGMWGTGSGGYGKFNLRDAGIEKVLLVGSGNSYLNGGNIGIGTTSPDRSLDVEGNGMVIIGTGGYTELMLRGQVEGTGTVRNVGAWQFSVRSDVGGDNDDLKLLRFITGSYEGTAIQVRSDTGGVAIGLNNQGYSSQILSVKSGAADNVFYGESTDTNCFASFRDNSSTANIEYGAIGNAHVFRKDTTEYMRITSGGQVGIGTPSPQDYDGESDDLVIFNATTPGITIATSDTTSKCAIRFADGTSGSERYIGGIEYQHAGDDMFFRTGGSLRMAIDSAGNVGIGTTDPSTLLNLEKSVDAFQALLIESTATWPVSNAAGSKFTNSSGSLYMFVDNGGGDYGPTGGTGAASAYAGNFRLTGAYPMQFATSDTLRMTIGSSGDVLINTHGKYLQGIRNTGSAVIDMIGFGSGTDTLQIKGGTSGAANAISYYDTGGFLGTWYNSNFGIGTTSPSAKLQVQQDQTAESNVIFMNNSTGANAAIRLSLNVGNPAGNDPKISFNIGDGGFDWTMGVDNSDSDKFKISGGTDSHNPNLGTNDQLVIDSSGNLTMTGDIIAYSDKKLKKNIKTLDGSKVYKMRGVSFDRINTGKAGSGVIAQEIQEVAPELISESNGTLGVAYGNISGYLIEAIKELKQEIEELKQKPCNCNNCDCKE